MPATVVDDHYPAQAPPAGAERPRRPILLSTLSVRICPDAERIALESALEADVPLIVANVIYPPPGWTTMIRLQEDLGKVRETATRAAALGIPTELVMRTPACRPVRALLSLARTHDVGLVIFGPDRRHIGRRRHRKAAEAICDGLDCLVWVAAD
jgi:hypothetical protein